MNDVRRPTAVVSIGLDASFGRTAQEERLDDHLVQLVTSLGGIAVFHDLEDDSSWQSLEDNRGFLRLRQLAMAHGLRTVVGVSLQPKDQAFGALLLGAPGNRRLSPAELQLLMALSQQIGMAIENSYLILQTRRRSEELRVLNEIGRALSSMLDQDALFEKMFTETQRLFDVTSFSIALSDEARNQIRFELEVADGVRLPKRARPLGNHLTERILRTRQPILIREKFEEETCKLGVEPLQRSGSFCGVPLIAYDRVIGVMAVRDLKEHRFDEGHLEMLHVLASQASIAIENARLFREERTKSRHLTLLNSISRNAITTLNLDEMLSNIAEQLDRGLAFDHIGIGLLDYSSREVIIHAEAGRRRGALGRCLELGEGLIGRVARTGQTCVARDFTNDAAGESVLEDSVSGIALRIYYRSNSFGAEHVRSMRQACQIRLVEVHERPPRTVCINFNLTQPVPARSLPCHSVRDCVESRSLSRFSWQWTRNPK